MSRQVAPEAIYIIRHGEKPQDAPRGHPHGRATRSGVDYHGNQNEHSLLPRGWQRSGALAALFDPGAWPPRAGPQRGPRAGLRAPKVLVSPSYGHAGRNAEHRTHQTVHAISDRLGVAITAQFSKGQERKLAEALLSAGPDVVLICWEHGHIPLLAAALPVVPGTVIPAAWPDDRYDVIWTFTLTESGRYIFAQVPQLLLSGDTDTVIE